MVLSVLYGHQSNYDSTFVSFIFFIFISKHTYACTSIKLRFNICFFYILHGQVQKTCVIYKHICQSLNHPSCVTLFLHAWNVMGGCPPRISGFNYLVNFCFGKVIVYIFLNLHTEFQEVIYKRTGIFQEVIYKRTGIFQEEIYKRTGIFQEEYSRKNYTKELDYGQKKYMIILGMYC